MPSFPIATSYAATPSKRRRILVADDDLAQIIANGLNSQPDMRADTAHDGPEALAQLSQRSYDAIVLNYRMPRMTGVEVLRQLRATGDAAPVIFISAWEQDEIPERLDGLTFDDWITKPFLMHHLIARVEQVIAHHSKRAGVSL